LSKEVLLERIDHYRLMLEDTIRSLDEEQLSQPGPEEWSIKDHLAHLAVWETGMVELLRKRPRFEAMGVEPAFIQGKSEEEINDLIFRQNKELNVQGTLQKFKQAHVEMLQLLDKLSDSDLHKPYSDYVQGGDVNRKDPVILWVIGNTYAHFDEHTAYIRRLLEDG
jgi:hypothetical protein